MSNKIAAGADFFQTQAVFDVEEAKAFLSMARTLGKLILLGLMPLRSSRMVEYVNKNIAGITIPGQIIGFF